MLNLKRRGSFLAWIMAITTISLLQGCKPESYTLTKSTEVDQPASFNGDVYRYLIDHITYPKAAIDQNIEGFATVKFIVDQDGRVLAGSVVKSYDSLLSAAVLQAVSGMPAWQPAKKNGRAVAVEFYLPVWFTLDKMVINMFSMIYREPLIGNQLNANGHVARVSAKLVKDNIRADDFEAAPMEVAKQSF